MKTTLQKVRDGIAAALLGKTPEQLADEQRRDAVKNAVDDYLIRNPDWKPSQQPAPAVSPVANTKQKAKRIMKTLGAGAVSLNLILWMKWLLTVLVLNVARLSHQILSAMVKSLPLHRSEQRARINNSAQVVCLVIHTFLWGRLHVCLRKQILCHPS